jgi:hypothetical protein
VPEQEESVMSGRHQPPPVVRLNGTAKLVAAAGIMIQYFADVPGYPTVPPGPIILAVVGLAVLLLAARRRWVLVLGLVAPLFLTVGGAIEGSSWDRLADPGSFGPFLGTAVQWVGMLTAVVACVLALTGRSRTRSRARG